MNNASSHAYLVLDFRLASLKNHRVDQTYKVPVHYS